jgi:rfaE bifunctional protein kinase chain/domain
MMNFKGKKVLVVGDVMLDEYIWGRTTRVSPEAPVVIVNADRVTHSLGGAGNVAANIVSLGAEAVVASVIGHDAGMIEIFKLMAGSGTSTSDILTSKIRQTTKKTRVMSGVNQVVRIDQEIVAPLAEQDERFLISNLAQHVDRVDAVVISDYCKGVVTDEVIEFVLENFENVLVDSKHPDYWAFCQDEVIYTPNEQEILAATGEKSVEAAAREIMSSSGCKGIVVTLGAKGMAVFDALDRSPFYISSKARQVFDVSGAGDTVVAVLALCTASGMTLIQSAVIANAAAGVAVGKLGTAAVSLDELNEVIK